MRPKGLIYSRKKSDFHGEVRITLPIIRRVVYHFTRGVGIGLVGYFFITVLFVFEPLLREELNYRFAGRDNGIGDSVGTVIDPAEADYTIKVQREADSFGVNSYFSVVIPKIGAYSDVIANVDTANKQEYQEALSNGVAHARGTYFPGQGKSVFLFAHSTDSPANIARFNAVFFLLRKLESGDKIIVFFADKKYLYEVTEKVVAEAGDTSWLDVGSEERLVLLTCDPPGTTWRRLLVIAKPWSVLPVLP